MTDDEISLRVVPIEGKTYQLSLSELVVKRVRDVGIGISTEFGGPVIRVSEIYFEDGTSLQVDGEHDIAYCYMPYGKAREQWPDLTERLLIRARNIWWGLGPDDEEYEDPEEYD